MKNKNKRVLHIIDSTKPAGAETILLEIVKGLKNNKFQSFIILPDKGWLYDKLSHISNMTIIEGSGRINFHFIYLLCKFILKNKINIIHSHLFGSSLYCCIAGILCRVPVICTFHGHIDINPNDKLVKLKLLIIGLSANKIISVSNNLKDYLKVILPAGKNKCITIYNGINLKKNKNIAKETTGNRLGFLKTDVLIGSVGNIKKVKGYGIFLRAAKIVLNRYPNCYFFVAGREIEKEYYKKLLIERKRLALEKKFYFVGFQEDPYYFLQSLDIFVLPSIAEGFSLSTVEAMNAGIPAVATKSGGPEEIIINNKNGILVNVGDETALANGIMRLIKNKEFSKKLIAAAHKTINEKFQAKTMIQKYEDIYSTLTNNTVF